jgi:hypothetical protein
MVEKFKTRSNVKKLASIIIEVIKISKKHGVNCWLNYGALLGVIREKRLLPWNNDAELSCWHQKGIEQKLILITDEMNQKGYPSLFYSSVGTISIKDKGVVININLIWKEEDFGLRPHELPTTPNATPFLGRMFYWLAIFMCAYPSGFRWNLFKILSMTELVKIMLISLFKVFTLSTRKRIFLNLLIISKIFGAKYQKTAIPYKLISDVVYCKFYGSKVLVPENPKKLIQFIYGKDWNVPKDKWSFYTEKNKKYSGIIFIDEMWEYSKMDIV